MPAQQPVRIGARGSKLSLAQAGQMQRRIAAALGMPSARVAVKATTNEGLGSIGRGEGIAAMAVASVELPQGVES